MPEWPEECGSRVAYEDDTEAEGGDESEEPLDISKITSGGMGTVRGDLGGLHDLDESVEWVGDDLDDGVYCPVEVKEDGTRVSGEWVGVDFDTHNAQKTTPTSDTHSTDTCTPIRRQPSANDSHVIQFPFTQNTPTRAEAVNSLESIQVSVSGQVSDTDTCENENVGVKRVPIHELDIIGWTPARSGRGRSIRFKLGSPAPDTGFMTRYYTWIPEDKYAEWKKHFTIEGAINASRNQAKLRAALRRRTG